MNALRVWLACCLCGAGFAGDVVSADQQGDQFSPAALRMDRHSLAHQISFPNGYLEGQDFSQAVACTAHVMRRGRLRYPYCWGGGEQTKSFERLVLDALPRVKMQPARVNGRRQEVVFKFTAIFQRMAGDESVTVVPHQFLNVDDFGVNHLGPQQIKSVSYGWPRVCRGIQTVVRLTIDQQGRASNPKLHAGQPMPNACFDGVVEKMPSLRFVPGFADGQPTTMDVLYLAGARGGWLTKGGAQE